MKILNFKEYKDSLEEMYLCPYCLEEVEFEPTSMCCSEVHGDLGYEDPIEERGMLDDIEDMHKVYVKEMNSRLEQEK